MKLFIQKNILINQSIEHVFNITSDLKKWNTWSPWVQCEPTSKTNVTGDAGQVGQVLEWAGDVIGSGRLQISEIEKNKSVRMNLNFLTPWKSFATVHFKFVHVSDQQTEVIWQMETKLPLFMFFFKNMMKAYMSFDFERGLKLLKEYSETGFVVSNSIYQGLQKFDQFYVVAKKTKCLVSEISIYARNDFEKLDSLHKQGKLNQPDGIVNLNVDFNIPKGTCEFAAGYLYKDKKSINLPEGYEVFELPSHNGLLVDYYGPYRNIANGWSMATTYQRSQKIKLLKKAPSYELYLKMPGQHPENEIHTQIIMPVK